MIPLPAKVKHPEKRAILKLMLMGRAPARSGVIRLNAIFASALRVRGQPEGMFCLFHLHWTCEPGSRGSASLPRAIADHVPFRLRRRIARERVPAEQLSGPLALRVFRPEERQVSLVGRDLKF